MASASVPGVHFWSNLHSLLVLGALGLSPRYGGGLRAFFLFDCVVAGSESQAKFIPTIEACPHHTRAPPRTSNSANLKKISTIKSVSNSYLLNGCSGLFCVRGGT
jgi:hypothetical protein